MKKIYGILTSLVLIMLMMISLSFAGSKSRAQWNYGLPIDGVMTNVPLVFLDVAAASNTAFKNTAISTATLVAAATTFTLANAGYTDIIVPRNIVIISSVQVPATYTGIAVISGTDHRGNAATESVNVSTWTGTSMGTGSVAWSSITSIALTTTETSAAALSIQVGSGNKIGLGNVIKSSSAIWKVIEAAALTTTYVLDATYNTITFVNAPDGTKDYTVWMAVGEK